MYVCVGNLGRGELKKKKGETSIYRESEWQREREKRRYLSMKEETRSEQLMNGIEINR